MDQRGKEGERKLGERNRAEEPRVGRECKWKDMWLERGILKSGRLNIHRGNARGLRTGAVMEEQGMAEARGEGRITNEGREL